MNGILWLRLLLAWFFISQFIMFAWAFRPKYIGGKEIFYRFNVREKGLVYRVAGKITAFSAFIGYGAVLSTGYEKILVFLPESWGYKDSGAEYLTVSASISYLLGGIGAFVLIILLIGYNEKREEKYLREERYEKR